MRDAPRTYYVIHQDYVDSVGGFEATVTEHTQGHAEVVRHIAEGQYPDVCRVDVVNIDTGICREVSQIILDEARDHLTDNGSHSYPEHLAAFDCSIFQRSKGEAA